MPELNPDKAKIDDFIRTLPRVIPRFEADQIPRASNIRFPPSAFGTGYISEDGQHAVKIMNLGPRIKKTSVDNIIESLKSELRNYYAITQVCANYFCKLVGYHYDILNTTLIIVMENCGTDLFDIYTSESIPDEKTQINHIGQIIDVIECLHQNWFVHFDIKPENIVLHNGRIKLIDAGSLTYVNNINNIVYVRGTNFYMAPELQDKTTIANSVGLLSTDIYSLGVLFLFMIIPSGRFREQLFKKMKQHKFSDNIGDSVKDIKKLLESIFGEAIEFKHFFGEPDERLTIQQLKSMYEQTHERKRKLDQMTSGGINTRKTHKRKLYKRRSNKRQRKSKSKSKSNK
jgi:serine/threonine protein kinase